MESSIDTIIKPQGCGIRSLTVSSGMYATPSYGTADLKLTLEEARELSAVLLAAVGAHAVAQDLLRPRNAVAAVEGDAVADANLPANAEVVS